MRKRFGGAIFISICLISGQPGFAQDPKLIAEAKKEGGKVLVYSSMETSIAESVGTRLRTRPVSKWNFGARLRRKSWIERSTSTEPGGR
jgi:hypothetical protein